MDRFLHVKLNEVTIMYSSLQPAAVYVFNFLITVNVFLLQGFQVALGVVLSVALVVGILGNILTIIVITSKRKLRTTTNLFVANLAVADIVLLAVNLPINIYEFFQGMLHL